MQSELFPKQQKEDKARAEEHQQKKRTEIANDVETNQNKSSLADNTCVLFLLYNAEVNIDLCGVVAH